MGDEEEKAEVVGDEEEMEEVVGDEEEKVEVVGDEEEKAEVVGDEEEMEEVAEKEKEVIEVVARSAAMLTARDDPMREEELAQVAVALALPHNEDLILQKFKIPITRRIMACLRNEEGLHYLDKCLNDEVSLPPFFLPACLLIYFLLTVLSL